MCGLPFPEEDHDSLTGAHHTAEQKRKQQTENATCRRSGMLARAACLVRCVCYCRDVIFNGRSPLIERWFLNFFLIISTRPKQCQSPDLERTAEISSETPQREKHRREAFVVQYGKEIPTNARRLDAIIDAPNFIYSFSPSRLNVAPASAIYWNKHDPAHVL
jgi:hypothetical protein